ncbi:MAG TPA: TonB-dependent receptor [Longimicrobiales bacterium]
MRQSWIVPLFTVLIAPAAAAQVPRYTLDTLHVSVGSRASAALPVATRSVEVIDADELARAPGATIADALVWAQGVDLLARSPAQADLTLRGGTFEQVLVLVDGVRMSDVQTGHFDLDLAVPLDEVERIEILRGPASALYGADAVGGVINVVTRRGRSGVTGRIEGGSFGTAGLSLSGGFGDDAFQGRIAGDFRRSDGHRPGTDYRTYQARAAVDARLGERTLRVDAAHAARDFGARDFYAPYPSYEETRTTTASLAWLAPQDARFSVEPRLSVRRHDDDFILVRDDPDLYRNVHTSWQLGGEVVARLTAAPGLRLAAGAEAYRDLLESTNLGDRRESRAALFAEGVAGGVGRAVLNAGIRADWHSEYGSFLAPSLSAALWPAAPLRLRASAGRAFRAPTWTERYYRDPANIGDPELQPERSWSAELGADFAPTPGLRLGLTGFIHAADHLIDWVRPEGSPASTPSRAMNVEEATFRGIEFEAVAADFLGARWTVRASALALDAPEAAGYTSKYALKPLTRTASLAVDRPLPGGFLLSARALHARRRGESAYFRSDVRLAYSHRQMRLYVDVLNATDAKYLDVVGAPAPGRAAYIGLAWQHGR